MEAIDGCLAGERTCWSQNPSENGSAKTQPRNGTSHAG